MAGEFPAADGRALILPREAGEGDHPPPLAAALSDARVRLASAGIDSAALDARLLLKAATGLDAARLIAKSREPLADAAARRFGAMLDRRCRREPVARILGEKEFWGLPIGLNPATLVPRPETEIVVEAALDAVRHFHIGPAIHICDLGTGSGAILIALLSELPHARGTGTDVSAEALAQAERNAERLGLVDRVCFELSDFGENPEGPFCLVVSNPPYVRESEIALLTPEARDFDPRAALDGGADGLDAYRAIARRLPRLVSPGGAAVLEVGAGQAHDVAALVAAQGMEVCELRRDLAGIARALVARRPSRA
jgi:release factor glutamine methyltransferase